MLYTSLYTIIHSEQPSSYINSDVSIYTQNTLFTSLLDRASTGASPAKLQIKAKVASIFTLTNEKLTLEGLAWHTV